MWLERQWYNKQLHPLLYLLTPLALLFWLLTNIRRSLYKLRLLPIYRSPKPVIVVGNISVGGTGKTPMTAALADFLRDQGLTPGIVSRGYGANTNFPHKVEPSDSAQVVGDEPLLLQRNAGCPVVISPNRSQAIKHLLKQAPDTDIVISDDGMQHYAMARDIEVILIDAERGIGNGWLLPCGPLREGPWRLNGAAWVVSLYAEHPFARYICPVENNGWRRVVDDEPVEPPTQAAYAIAGIGNPHRFFHGLRKQKLELLDTESFPDHYQFKLEDFAKFQQKPVLMTEKDAAKCRDFAPTNWYYQPIKARLPAELTASLSKRLNTLIK